MPLLQSGVNFIYNRDFLGHVKNNFTIFIGKLNQIFLFGGCSMKKIVFILLCIIMIFSPFLVTYAEEINEQSMEDFILVFLAEPMYKAVDEYYGESRMFDLYDAKIIEINPLKEGERFSSKIKVQVFTYVGAHNPPHGIETITMTNDFGDIKVTKFEHEDFNSKQRSKR
jgi:hypothetical protein